MIWFRVLTMPHAAWFSSDLHIYTIFINWCLQLVQLKRVLSIAGLKLPHHELGALGPSETYPRKVGCQ